MISLKNDVFYSSGDIRKIWYCDIGDVTVKPVSVFFQNLQELINPFTSKLDF